jgi:hypothetical protein
LNAAARGFTEYRGGTFERTRNLKDVEQRKSDELTELMAQDTKESVALILHPAGLRVFPERSVHVFCAKCTETYTALSHLLREAAKQHNT